MTVRPFLSALVIPNERVLETAALEGMDDDGGEGAPATPQYLTPDADRPPSYIHEPLADSPPQVPQPILDAALVPPPLSVMSPEPLWMPHFRTRLDKLISVLVTSAFQLLWRCSDGTFVIKPADLIAREHSRDDQQHKLHLLRRLVAIIFQEYTLLCISPAGSYESAARDGALISQGRR
jgi:hypothetical protein